MSEKMKDSDETREEKFEERMLKYTKLKKKKRLMPIELVSWEEYEEILSILKQVHNLFGSMYWNPKPKSVPDLQDRIKAVLEQQEF